MTETTKKDAAAMCEEVKAILTKGSVTEEEEKRVYELLLAAVKTGYPEAYGILGEIYRGKKDYETAKKFYEDGYSKGDKVSAFGLGTMYFYGRGVKEDKALGVKYWKDAAKGCKDKLILANVCYEIGSSYANGNGVKVDNKEAFKWYQKGSQAGDCSCALNCFRAYYLGLFGKANKAKAWIHFANAMRANPDMAWKFLEENATAEDQNKLKELTKNALKDSDILKQELSKTSEYEQIVKKLNKYDKDKVLTYFYYVTVVHFWCFVKELSKYFTKEEVVYGPIVATLLNQNLMWWITNYARDMCADLINVVRFAFDLTSAFDKTLIKKYIEIIHKK